MLLTRAVPSLNSGFEVLCVQMQAPCYTIVCDQAEAPVSWHDKVPPVRRGVAIGRTWHSSRITHFGEIDGGRPSTA